jgi:hypothetical protein
MLPTSHHRPYSGGGGPIPPYSTSGGHLYSGGVSGYPYPTTTTTGLGGHSYASGLPHPYHMRPSEETSSPPPVYEAYKGNTMPAGNGKDNFSSKIR